MNFSLAKNDQTDAREKQKATQLYAPGNRAENTERENNIKSIAAPIETERRGDKTDRMVEVAVKDS